MKKNTIIKSTLFAVFASLFLTISAQAQLTFTVDRTDDANVSTCTVLPNDCTLRGAITAANAVATNDVIDFDPAVFNADTTIILTSALPNIANNGTLTINAPTSIRVTVSGNNAFRVFNINTGATFAVNNLTIANGFIANQTGGGILNNGTLTLTNCTLDNNRNSNQNGGGIFNNGTLSITNCTLSNNTTSGNGGAVANAAANSSLTINNSTINGNTAIDGRGGAIYNGTFGNQPGIVTLILNNSTISDNSAGNTGGGISSSSLGSIVSLNSTTFSGNSSGTTGGGIYSANAGIITLNNTIIANSPSGGDCAISAGGNFFATFSLVEDGSCNVMNGVSNNLTGDPNLGPLQNNGGSTETHALLTGSIAIDAGNSMFSTDQRGVMRPQGAADDIGSFELEIENSDSDGDGIFDDMDNCPNTANADQADNDMDMIGDACDPDDDNDGVADENDAFPFDPNESADNDNDGIGNNADPDDDNDGQTDANEMACGSNPLDAASKSPDADGDNIPDCVDTDDDNDGIPDTCDIDQNPGAEDFDRDGIVDGSGCDTVIGPPTDKDQCKNDGYKRFNNPTFRNQGQCVSYVNGRRP